uniref:DUF4371 domain-containing protein n=1 Tax=Latimeria chalumnae TaxID=7897 RepID=H3ANI8_LATCH
SKGYSNWKDACVNFKKHELSNCHEDSVFKVVTVPKSFRDIGKCLSSVHEQQQRDRHHCFLKILQNVKYLAQQGLVLRGDRDESDSNFIQSKLTDWNEQKTSKYTSPEIQNEMLRVLGLRVLREITEKVRSAEFFSIMIDETKDSANKEQVVICVRWVDDNFEAHEEFVGLYTVGGTDANTLVQVIKDVLIHSNLSIRKVTGQCYDGAAVMAGKSGVAQQISEAEPKALFVHCYGRSLYLACCDAVNKCKEIKTALEITHGSHSSVLDNYEVLQKTWIADKDRVQNLETKIRILGVSSQMKSFDFLFGAALGEVLFHHCNNLSTTLQSPEICASEGQNLARMTVVTLKSLSSKAEFKKFWIQVQEMTNNQDVDEPKLPRKRKAPSRFEDGTSPAAFPTSVEDHYCKIYETGFNIVTSCIEERFEQPGFQAYAKLEQLILKTIKGGEYEEEFHYITQLYADDLDASSLQAQLQALAANFAMKNNCSGLRDVIDFMKNLYYTECQFFSNVAVCALRLIKNYLRTTMSQARLNHLMLLHIHKNVTDSLNLLEVANEFVEGSEHR